MNVRLHHTVPVLLALSVAAAPLAKEFQLDPVQLGYLFSSFLWLYVVCLVPMGLIVDRLGSRTVNAPN